MEVSSGPFVSGAYHRRRVSLVPVLAGIAALVAGVLVLRTYGPRYRVGRLLASTPQVGVAEAVAMAAGPARYVRISGRIDAEDEFEDDAHRPLVFRRTRLQLRRDDRWVDFEDDRRRVPFEVRDGLDGIAVDDAALDVGLVVVPRESVGTAADVADRVPRRDCTTTPVRLWVEQVSSVEHAIVIGVPGLDEAGAPRISAGLGRPLILTTLEPDEAMRVLAEGERRRPLVALVCLGGGLGLIAVGLVLAVIGAVVVRAARRLIAALAGAGAVWLLTALTVLAASPSPDPAGGDPRSAGQGPGLVGDPGFAVAGGRRHRRFCRCWRPSCTSG